MTEEIRAVTVPPPLVLPLLTLNAIVTTDAPELILPGTQITDEDTTILFSSATGNSITTSDADAAETEPGKIQLSLSVAHGTPLSHSAGYHPRFSMDEFHTKTLCYSYSANDAFLVMALFEFRPKL